MSKHRKNFRQKIISQMKELEPSFYSESEHDYLRQFITNYTESDYDQIEFRWNGEHAESFFDNNFSLREKVMFFYILHSKEIDNSLLLKDLLVEQAKFSKESWGVVSYFGLLGELLLNSSRDLYICQFIKALGMSMDTYCSCSIIRLNNKVKAQVLERIDDMISKKDFTICSEKELINAREFISNR